MLLRKILSDSGQFQKFLLKNLPEIEITGVSHDSREIKEGNIFVALTGSSFNGHGYIQKAIDKGAVAIVGEQDLDLDCIPYFRVDNSRKALAYLAAALNISSSST